MNNLLEFDYTDFDKETIQLYLETIYKVDKASDASSPKKRSKQIFKLLKLVEFLKWEGKNMVSDFEKNTCQAVLDVLKLLLDEIHLDVFGVGWAHKFEWFSVTTMLVHKIMKSFDNPDYQNLNERTRSILLNRNLGQDADTSIVDIMNHSDQDLYFIEAGINRSLQVNKSLAEWVLGYELTDESRPTAQVEIYWLVKDMASEIGDDFEESETIYTLIVPEAYDTE